MIRGRKHCEKRRDYLLQAISPFLTMFSTAIYIECNNRKSQLKSITYR